MSAQKIFIASMILAISLGLIASFGGLWPHSPEDEIQRAIYQFDTQGSVKVEIDTLLAELLPVGMQTSEVLRKLKHAGFKISWRQSEQIYFASWKFKTSFFSHQEARLFLKVRNGRLTEAHGIIFYHSL